MNLKGICGNLCADVIRNQRTVLVIHLNPAHIRIAADLAAAVIAAAGDRGIGIKAAFILSRLIDRPDDLLRIRVIIGITGSIRNFITCAAISHGNGDHVNLIIAGVHAAEIVQLTIVVSAGILLNRAATIIRRTMEHKRLAVLREGTRIAGIVLILHGKIKHYILIRINLRCVLCIIFYIAPVGDIRADLFGNLRAHHVVHRQLLLAAGSACCRTFARDISPVSTVYRNSPVPSIVSNILKIRAAVGVILTGD